jgi:16S rRNA G966 N2-methylase RsmD
MPYASKKSADAIAEYFDGADNINIIIDATAHIGADAINFHRRFGASVICLENDTETYKCLLSNMRTIVGDVNPNFCVPCNALEFIKGFKKQVDFVYIDPPWGGPGYWEYKTIMLYLEYNGHRVPLYDVVSMVFNENFTKTVIVKVPSNFDFITFRNKTITEFSTVLKKIMKRRKDPFTKPNLSYYLMFCSLR